MSEPFLFNFLSWVYLYLSMEFKTADAQFFIIGDILFKDFGGLKFSTHLKFI